MPDEVQVARATLQEIRFDEQGDSVDEEFQIDVQFNPESLTVTYENEKKGNESQAQTGIQYVGQGKTTVKMDLLFDVTRDDDVEDVRERTRDVNYFLRPKDPEENDGKFVSPGLRFSWGSFLLEGVMESMDETLEFFDNEGRPLRATVSISISESKIDPRPQAISGDVPPPSLFGPEEGGSPESTTGGEEGGGPPSPSGPGSQAEQRPPGSTGAERPQSIQQVMAQSGKSGDWKSCAAANGVENPRAIYNASALDLSARVETGL